MLINNLKKISLFYNFIIWSKNLLINLSRLKDVMLMMIVFHIWPEQTYRFSTRRVLPKKENRFSKKTKPFIPYDLLTSKSSDIKKMKEINVIGRGSSFDLNNLKNIKGPIFLISFWNSLKIDDNGKIFYKHYFSYETGKFLDNRNQMTKKDLEDYLSSQTNYSDYKNDNCIYVTGRPRVMEMLKKNGHNILSLENHVMDEKGNYFSTTEQSSSYLNLIDNDQCKRISVAEKVYKGPLLTPHLNFVPTGSLLPCLFALSHVAEKINVYGWDNHLSSSPNKMGYWRLFFDMYKYKTDVFRWKAQYEHALINFYYGYQLSKSPNFNIHGYMGQLDKHKKLIKKIERVLFN